MRFRLKLEVLHSVKGNAMPINYQYELSSAIYKIIAKSDMNFAQWLHDNGFEYNNKNFKLFSYSWLNVPRYTIDKERERLIINSDFVEWHISFLPEISTQQFIKGLFEDQFIEISDNISGVIFKVKEIQLMPTIEYASEMEFITISPICVSFRNEFGSTDYLSPKAPNYKEGLLSGLLSKYSAFYGDDCQMVQNIDFQVIGQFKPVLVKIKANTPAQTFVKAYNYRFKLSLPEPLMHIAYNCGLGEKCSMGFGMIKVV